MDGNTESLLAVNDADGLCRVVMQLVVFLLLHDALLVKAVQPVGDDAHERLGQVGNAVGKVGIELLHHLQLRLLIIFIIGLVAAQGTVALLTDNTLRLIDGEIVWGRELWVFPGLPLFHLEVAAVVAWHSPHHNANCGQDQRCAYQNIAPLEIVFQKYAAHFALFWCKDTKKLRV